MLLELNNLTTKNNPAMKKGTITQNEKYSKYVTNTIFAFIEEKNTVDYFLNSDNSWAILF